MSNTQVFNYTDTKQVRVIIVEGKPWWFLTDLRKIVGVSSCSITGRRFSEDARGYFGDKSLNANVARSAVINEKGLEEFFVLLANRNSARRLKKWIEQKVLPNLDKTGGYPASYITTDYVIRNEPDTSITPAAENKETLSPALPKSVLAEPLKNPPSNELQRAELLMQLADKKGIPEVDRLYLLDMAMRELTGDGLSIVKPARANVMELPEVFGVGVRSRRRKVGGKHIVLHPALVIAEDTGISPATINNYADLHNLKNSCNGYWIPVRTPEGNAREFMYTEEACEQYFDRLA